MARMRLLDLVRPFSLALPEVEMPYHKVDQTEKLVYTVCAAILYALLAEISVYGLPEAQDPIPWLRGALGSSSGTLAELGVIPIVLSGMTCQILAGIRKISVNLEVRSDRALFQSLQKLVALGISAVYSILFALGAKAAPTSTVLIAAQLFVGSASLIYIDEILSKGYGIVTGTVLYTLVRTSQNFAWTALSLASVPVPGLDGLVTYGAFPSLFFNLKNRSFNFAVSDFVFRTYAPNLVDVALAVAAFLATLYFGLVRLNLQIRSTRMRGQASTFPVRLAYAGMQPVLYASSLLGAVLLFSYGLNNVCGSACKVTSALGLWDKETGKPVTGLVYFLVPNLSANVLVSLIRVVFYLAIFGAVGAAIGNLWTKSSGFAPQDVAKSFKENSIVLVGKRDQSVVRELRRIIPLAATLGGLLSGLLAGAGDILSAHGWGSAMLVSSMGAFTVFEQLASEGTVGPEAMQQFM